MKALVATFKLVTPLFLGGANPDTQPAELRVQSIKGALRFWYRAIDAGYNKPSGCRRNNPTWEELIFGSARTGQGAFSLKLVRPNKILHGKWDKDSKLCSKYRDGNKNGITYLAFSMDAKRNSVRVQRQYIGPQEEKLGLSFHIREGICPPEKAEHIEKALLASIWLFGHIGGLGSRSRRGFGTVALNSWELDNSEIGKPAIAHKETTPDAWVSKFQEGLKMIKGWFSGNLQADHSVLDDKAWFYLLPAFDDKGPSTWDSALNIAGRAMQDFRQRRTIKDADSDYERVKAHLAECDKEADTKGVVPMKLTTSPDRAAFGLPLNFFFSNSLKKKVGTDRKGNTIWHRAKTEFKGREHERSASPIHIRIVNIGGKFHSLFIRLDTLLLSVGENIKDGYGDYTPPTGAILDAFKSYLITTYPNGKEGSL